MFVAALPMAGFSWGEQLTVIYVVDKILTRTVSFVAHRLRSPFHVSKCQRISKRFAEELNEELSATCASRRFAPSAARLSRNFSLSLMSLRRWRMAGILAKKAN